MNTKTDGISSGLVAVAECVTFIPDRIRKVESGFKGLFIKEAKAYKQGWNDCRAAMLSAAPTPPVSEGVDPVMTKEELIAAAESIGMCFPGASIPPSTEDQKDAEILDQCRLNGMGAEREATLLGKVERQSAALKLAKDALGEMQDLIDESYGVYGLHLNGDESPWSELEQGGRFERLITLNEALAAINEVLG